MFSHFDPTVVNVFGITISVTPVFPLNTHLPKYVNFSGNFKSVRLVFANT